MHHVWRRLGVVVPRDADETAIKKSFRKLARELHPDVNAHDPQAEDKFKEAAEAYEILSNPERREIYDRHGHEGLRSGGMGPNFEGFGSISDLFEAFFGAGFGGGFGGRGGGPSQGDDAILGVEIDLREAAAGMRVPVTFEAVDPCGRCSGVDALPGPPPSLVHSPRGPHAPNGTGPRMPAAFRTSRAAATLPCPILPSAFGVFRTAAPPKMLA